MWKRWGLVLWLAALIGPLSLRADQEFDDLQKTFADARKAYSEQVKKLRAELPADGKLDESKLPPEPSAAFLPRFRAYAEKNAGKPEALPALAWVVNNAADSEGKPLADLAWALEQIEKDHAADPAMAKTLPSLSFVIGLTGKAPIRKLADVVQAKATDPSAKAAALYTQAWLQFQSVHEQDGRPAEPADVPAARQLFEKALREFPDTRAAERSKGYLFEIDHLQIGMPAPELEGTSIEERPIKLSQFRGQVVVLDFWGFW